MNGASNMADTEALEPPERGPSSSEADLSMEQKKQECMNGGSSPMNSIDNECERKVSNSVTDQVDEHNIDGVKDGEELMGDIPENMDCLTDTPENKSRETGFENGVNGSDSGLGDSGRCSPKPSESNSSSSKPSESGSVEGDSSRTVDEELTSQTSDNKFKTDVEGDSMCVVDGAGDANTGDSKAADCLQDSVEASVPNGDVSDSDSSSECGANVIEKSVDKCNENSKSTEKSANVDVGKFSKDLTSAEKSADEDADKCNKDEDSNTAEVDADKSVEGSMVTDPISKNSASSAEAIETSTENLRESLLEGSSLEKTVDDINIIVKDVSETVSMDTGADDLSKDMVEENVDVPEADKSDVMEVEDSAISSEMVKDENSSTVDVKSACEEDKSVASDTSNKMETETSQTILTDSAAPSPDNTVDGSTPANCDTSESSVTRELANSNSNTLGSIKESEFCEKAPSETSSSKTANVLQPLGKPAAENSTEKVVKPILKLKATARKSGQPVTPKSVVVSSKDGSISGSGTIKIINYRNSKSNITLKLSELEDVLKVKDMKTVPRLAVVGSGVKSQPDTEKTDSVMSADSATTEVSTTTQMSENSVDSSKKQLGRARFRKKRRGGTYNFPGMKKVAKKKKKFSLTGGDSVDSKSEDSYSDFEPFRKVHKKMIGSPKKHCNALDLLTKNSHRAFRKRRNVFRRKSNDSPLKGKTVMDFLKERQAATGEKTIVSNDALNTAVTICKDGLVSAAKTSGEDSENLAGQRKRKIAVDEGLQATAEEKADDLAKKRKVGEGDDKSKAPVLQPMVMVVTNHLANSPGLRSILPKVGASPLAPGCTGQMVVSGGQPIFVPAQPLLLQPGTKVSLVPTSVSKSGIPFITTVARTKTSTPVLGGKVTSPPVLIDLRPGMSSQQGGAGTGTDALRALLAKSGGMTSLKTVPVSMFSGLIPASMVSIASPIMRPSTVTSNASNILNFSQVRTVRDVGCLKVVSSVTPSTSSSMSSKVSAISSASALAARLMASAEAKAAASLPNGISILATPPKTPEGEALADGTSYASSGVAADRDVLPLCCCKIGGANFTKLLSGATYCQALDSVDGRALGCCNKVTNTQLVRPGVKIPFMLVCEVHRRRLKLHQCCPGCGHFCTEGKFFQCQREGGKSVHSFHKQCQTERAGKLFCPHCGEESGQVEVTLTLNDAKPKESNEQIRANLRKSIAKARMTPGSTGKKKADASPGVSVTLPNSKIVSTDGLPVGPEREHLERLMALCNSKAERPKKYRILPKHMYPPATEGDVEKVFYMLMDGMDPNEPYEEEDNQTPLHGATYSGTFAMVYLLVQAGAFVHTQDKTLKTPLMCASDYGYLAITKYLVTAGARLDDRGEDRMTCLHYAAKAGHLDIIQYILDTEALDVNVTDEGGWTPIMWATESQLVEVVRYLVSRDGDPNKKDNEENNGLHWAAFAGSVGITELFLEMGCEVDTPNEHGDRPLHIAARQNHYEVVVILLARGANVDVRNNKDETPVACCPDANSQVSMALKVNKQLRSFAVKLRRPERLLHRDASVGREENPIACVNDVDDEPYPTDYLYVNHNVETQDLHINNVITSLQSCRCKDDCSSLYCVCARSSVKCWYDKFGRLLEDFSLLDPPHIFECNRACRCWVNCNNRVVQNGITCRLQMFRTSGRGWGVRSLMDIPKGAFICEYIGELISDSEADRREDDSYLFDLDNKDGDTYCIDARKYGNVARFINHLCEPNIVPVKVFIEHQDLRFPRICFFSSREIKAYEELGFDYGEKFWIIKWKQFTCACGSPKCKYSTETIKRTLEEYRLRHEDEEVAQDT